MAGLVLLGGLQPALVFHRRQRAVCTRSISWPRSTRASSCTSRGVSFGSLATASGGVCPGCWRRGRTASAPSKGRVAAARRFTSTGRPGRRVLPPLQPIRRLATSFSTIAFAALKRGCLQAFHIRAISSGPGWPAPAGGWPCRGACGARLPGFRPGLVIALLGGGAGRPPVRSWWCRASSTMAASRAAASMAALRVTRTSLNKSGRVKSVAPLRQHNGTRLDGHDG